MTSKVIHVRMNEEELETFKELKKLINQPEDSAAIKAAIACSVNVSQRLFGGNLTGIFHLKKQVKEEH